MFRPLHSCKGTTSSKPLALSPKPEKDMDGSGVYRVDATRAVSFEESIQRPGVMCLRFRV